MRRRTFAALLIVAAAATASAAQANRRSYLVTVIPEAGAPVTNLTTTDFKVREEGTEREVISAEVSKFPLAVSLLIDMTQQVGNNMVSRELRTAVTSFVAALRAAEKDVKIALVEVGAGAVTAADFDAPPEKLDAIAQRLLPAHPGDAVMLEAIGLAAKSLQAFQTPRRAIVTIDFNSSESMSEATMKRMSDALHQSGATVWSVSVRLPRAQGSRREGALNMITKNSGGLRQVAGASSGLEALLKRVADSLASQYIVDFARPGESPIKTIEMDTKQGLKVHVSPMRR